MGKKRKASGHNDAPKGPKELDAADARLGPVSTYEDVANSEDEFFLNQDRLMVDDGPTSKRQRQDDEELELSDEEILGYEDSDEEDEADDFEEQAQTRPNSKAKSKGRGRDSGEDDEDQEQNDEDSGWWGSSKQEYYDADNIETEADALEEEAEAKRLQQKKLSKMREEDFVFDGDEWLAGEAEEDDEDKDKITEVLKDIEVTADMGSEERSRLLSTRYPEFEHLAGELDKLQPLLAEVKNAAAKKPATSIEAVKYWVLGCYVATLASYFAILTSPARDASRMQKPLSSLELRDHDVMETLLACRAEWDRVKNMTSGNDAEVSSMASEVINNEAASGDAVQILEADLRAKRFAKKSQIAAEKQAKKLAKAKAIEDSVADLYSLPIGAKRPKATKKSTSAPAQQDGDRSDFGEEDTMDARTAAAKAARKKSLKFYTSQIAQKANKRADAGRDAGGDMDIPHRERLRDRQQRLLAAAEKRGQRDSKFGADLGDDSSDDDKAAANALRNGEDEYYDMVANKSKNKREDKAARYAAYAAASKADRVVENEEVGDDGKRKITYAIEKNKGLAPKRNKDVRNPRVKRRKQYEAKQKKLKSMRPVWKGGEPKGGYKGELSGINTGVVKSIKL